MSQTCKAAFIRYTHISYRGTKLEIKDYTEGGISIVAVSGELDSTSSSQLTKRLDTLLDGGNRNIIIDLGGVEYLASAGLAALIQCLKHVRNANGNLCLVSLQPQVQGVFGLTRLDRVFDFYSDVAEAMRHLAHT